MTITVVSSRPATVPDSVREMVLSHFLGRGGTMHSEDGTTLPLVIDYCHAQGIPYELTYTPGVGYYCRRIETFIPELTVPGLISIQPERGDHGNASTTDTI